MKPKFILLVFLLFVKNSFTQSISEAPQQHISTDSNVTFRLFSTKNMYTFIKLDTRNGQMWQVQWGTENKYRFENILSDILRVNKEEERKQEENRQINRSPEENRRKIWLKTSGGGEKTHIL